MMDAKTLIRILDEYVPDPQIPLRHKDPFTLLIAVMLSAQCTDERVNLITPRLFEKAATPEEMARLDAGEIAAIIRPCGLAPTKAKAIRALSRLIIERHGGRVPNTLEELEALPGVGHKTASVVLIQAFRKPALPVDTHIFRSARRWGLSQAKTVPRVERDLKALFPQRLWGKIHLQIILFARAYCPARGHDKAKCPICSRL